MPLISGGRPFQLHDYQLQCCTSAAQQNIICALPVGSGKTVIAAEVISRTLDAEAMKKIIFVVPYGALAEQQLGLLLRQIDRLHTGDEVTPDPAASNAERARWRAVLVVGSSVGLEATTPWRRCGECQVLVMTPALFERALSRGRLTMAEIALIVIDEVRIITRCTFCTCQF